MYNETGSNIYLNIYHCKKIYAHYGNVYAACIITKKKMIKNYYIAPKIIKFKQSAKYFLKNEYKTASIIPCNAPYVIYTDANGQVQCFLYIFITGFNFVFY